MKSKSIPSLYKETLLIEYNGLPLGVNEIEYCSVMVWSSLLQLDEYSCTQLCAHIGLAIQSVVLGSIYSRK